MNTQPGFVILLQRDKPAMTRNTFDEQSSAYASYRPGYPDALYDWLTESCTRRDRAWDCATGNGQAAVGLAGRFGTVNATDVSEEQISHATPDNRITYSVQSAEEAGFAESSFDLVVVAQALHWFDFSRFWPEVLRVSRTDAVFCAWGYNWFHSTKEINENLLEPLRSLLLPFWAQKNQILWRGYLQDDIQCPFRRLEHPEFEIQEDWTISQIVKYIQTWSAFKKSRADRRVANEVDRVISRACRVIPPNEHYSVRMPLEIVAARTQVELV